MDRAILCILKTPAQAEQVITELRAAGFTGDDISGLLADKRETKEFAHEQNTKAPAGAMTGAGAGGLLGGSLGWLAGIGSLAIPGVGPFLAAGPIVAALSGVAVGAAMGGLTGALIGMGLSEEEAKQYEEEIEGGKILISVHTDHPHQREVATEIFEKAGGEDIHVTGATRE
jgi:uncharacterized membrane protein